MLDMPMTRIRGEVPVGRRRRYRLPFGLTLLIWLLLIVPAVGAVALGFPPILAPPLWIGLSIGVVSIVRAQILIAHTRIEQAELIGRVKEAMETDRITVLEDPEPVQRDSAWDDAEAELDRLRARLIECGGRAAWNKEALPPALADRLIAARFRLDMLKARRTIAPDYWETVVTPAEQARDEVLLAIGEHVFGTTLAACAALPALKRPFRLIADCQHGHVGEHLVTTAPTRDQVGRACCVRDCTSTWTELV
jgi:hypothetical protein